MATVKQYVLSMRDMQWDVAQKLGSDLATADPQTRAAVLSGLVVQAAVLKVIVDSGVITDGQLASMMNAVRSAAFAQEPAQPTGWSAVAVPVTGAPITGIGSL